MKDLFGNEILNDRPAPRHGKSIGFVWGPRGTSKRDERPRGYAAAPGTGPAGETCKSCNNAVRTSTRSDKTFWKCILLRRLWSASYGTDIRASAPACSFFTPLITWTCPDCKKVFREGYRSHQCKNGEYKLFPRSQ